MFFISVSTSLGWIQKKPTADHTAHLACFSSPGFYTVATSVQHHCCLSAQGLCVNLNFHFITVPDKEELGTLFPAESCSSNHHADKLHHQHLTSDLLTQRSAGDSCFMEHARTKEASVGYIVNRCGHLLCRALVLLWLLLLKINEALSSERFSSIILFDECVVSAIKPTGNLRGVWRENKQMKLFSVNHSTNSHQAAFAEQVNVAEDLRMPAVWRCSLLLNLHQENETKMMLYLMCRIQDISRMWLVKHICSGSKTTGNIRSLALKPSLKTQAVIWSCEDQPQFPHFASRMSIWVYKYTCTHTCTHVNKK